MIFYLTLISPSHTQKQNLYGKFFPVSIVLSCPCLISLSILSSGKVIVSVLYHPNNYYWKCGTTLSLSLLRITILILCKGIRVCLKGRWNSLCRRGNNGVSRYPSQQKIFLRTENLYWNCSAWPRPKLNTKVTLNNHHHPPPQQTFWRVLTLVGG